MTSDIILLVPELTLLLLACGVLLVDCYTGEGDKPATFWLAQASLVVVICLVAALSPEGATYAFGGSFISDPMSVTLKLTLALVTLVVFFYSYDYLKEHEIVRGEYFVLGLFALLGMMVMVSAGSLLTVYLGLELLSLSLYAMIAMHRTSQLASEAAMKYFVLGALASGMLLYGISMIYGVTGALDMQGIAEYVGQNSDQQSSLLLVFGVAFMIVGIAFKLGAVPFHMWLPDIYEGSPTAVTLFISTAPKVAGFAMAIRVLADGMQGLLPDWQGMLIILAVLSMAVGNIIAIAQVNLKRMLAYSTISHVGFFLLGLISGTGAGYAASMFYIIIYAVMSMGSFGMIILLGRKGLEADLLSDFKGLARRSPWYAFIMLILMFSMAGIPPLAGFWAKWFVFKELIATGNVWLAAAAVVFSVIGAFYYLRVIKLMFFDDPDKMEAIKATREMRFALSLNGLLILAAGFMPGFLMTICLNALG